MKETKEYIKLGIDAGFLGPAFFEKVISEALEQGSVFETESESSKWGQLYRGFNAPHNYKVWFY